MTKHSQLAVGRPGDPGEQIDKGSGLRGLVDENAERGFAEHGRTDPEAGRADRETAAAPHADSGSDHGIRAHDCVAGRHSFPRI